MGFNTHDDFKIKKFQFSNFNKNKEEVQGKLNLINFEKKLPDDIDDEYLQAQDKEFSVTEEVSLYRGHQDKKRGLIEKEIESKVQKQIDEIYKKKCLEGIEEGKRIGKEEVLRKEKSLFEEKMVLLQNFIDDIVETKQKIMNTEKEKIYDLIKALVKWIVLKEIKDDDQYILRLLERLIQEIDERSNLIFSVNEKYLEKMPEIIEILEEKFGKIAHFRVVKNDSSEDLGASIDSKYGLIDGGLQTQLESLDKIFEEIPRE